MKREKIKPKQTRTKKQVSLNFFLSSFFLCYLLPVICYLFFSCASADTFTIRSDSDTTAKINIKLANNNMVISGDSGGDEDNWNGTWRKQ
jgi:hypothetical protein